MARIHSLPVNRSKLKTEITITKNEMAIALVLLLLIKSILKFKKQIEKSSANKQIFGISIFAEGSKEVQGLSIQFEMDCFFIIA